jgi:hypothetical protein
LGTGQFAEAERVARECLTLREIEIPDNWRTFNAQSMLGGALLGLKKYSDAEPLLRSGYEGLKQRQNTIPAAFARLRVSEAAQRLAQLYDATSKPDKAAEWRKELEVLNLTKQNGAPP